MSTVGKWADFGTKNCQSAKLLHKICDKEQTTMICIVSGYEMAPQVEKICKYELSTVVSTVLTFVLTLLFHISEVYVIYCGNV